jgi:hypothetical protein
MIQDLMYGSNMLPYNFRSAGLVFSAPRSVPGYLWSNNKTGIAFLSFWTGPFPGAWTLELSFIVIATTATAMMEQYQRVLYVRVIFAGNKQPILNCIAS